MGTRILNLPLILPLTGLFSLAMLGPALHAFAQGDHSVARVFFYSAVLGLVLVTVTGLALGGRGRGADAGVRDLAGLFMAYTLMPLLLALPFYEGLETTSYLNAYVEMVSSLTTTGATLFTDPGRLTDSLHLWRGLVGWLGGLMIWVSAAAVLAPLHLGGFEVSAQTEDGRAAQRIDQFRRAGSARRIARHGAQLVPVYTGLTGALWVMLLICGERPLVALIHAMSTLATSGISPVGGLPNAGAGVAGEALIFLFLGFALSRLTFSSDTATAAQAGLRDDPELRFGLGLVAAVALILFLRHWIAAYDVDEVRRLGRALAALWGTVFTVLSFLTTTGFESAAWGAARDWSGLGAPGLVLMGLAIVGGGVATTAGGVKLLRVYALYLGGRREMERLLHPSSVGRAGQSPRRIRREGAFIAWIFFMLFALSLAVVTVLFATLGQDIEAATVLAIAALSTTGPLTQAAAGAPIDLLGMGAAAKLLFCAAMVLGRLETLAIIALMNPALWRG
ncbi:MAG: TrkH family potassium uptake protein [Roseovarius sp.]|nr:TrkH family potassium uptake protein [Roseovarius sp.]